jgi:hypothetical protein
LPNVGPYTYDVKALQGAPYIYNISRLRVKLKMLQKSGETERYSGMATLHTNMPLALL